MKRKHKKLLIFITILALIVCSIGTVFASSFMEEVARSTGNSSDITGEIGSASDNLIKTARQLAVIVAGIMVILIGFGMFFGSNSQSMAKYKVFAAVFILAMFLVFKTESIVGFLLRIFGVDIGAL